MEQKNECYSDLVDKFYKEDRLDRIDEILCETRVLKEFQHLMVKHAMDSMSETFQSLYYNQQKFLIKLKKEYEVKYGR